MAESKQGVAAGTVHETGMASARRPYPCPSRLAGFKPATGFFLVECYFLIPLWIEPHYEDVFLAQRPAEKD